MIGGFTIADGEPHEQLVEENLARDDEPTKAERELLDEFMETLRQVT